VTAASRTLFVLTRETPFSYQCGRCLQCCRSKTIPLNPYEVARLAAYLGETTTQFLARHTVMGGAALRRRDDEACVFLGEDGCTVHPARPLACRLYPLGRRVAGNGDETFAELDPHPETAGAYGIDGTIAGYIAKHDVAKHFAAADRYSRILKRMLIALSKRDDRRDVDADATEALGRAPTAEDDNVLDMDATVLRYCASKGRPAPTEVEEKTLLHIEALEAFVGGVEAGAT
jgi:hypothetical protein